MPYANIHWIKLKLEILNDKRFIFDCTNDQKWLFIGLLLLAASTKNRTPNDENFIKNRLNLPENSVKVRENIDFLATLFPKLSTRGNFIIFKNFNGLHNRVKEFQRNSEGTPMVPVDKNRIDKIRTEYLGARGISLETFSPDDFSRTGGAIKKLIFRAGGDDNLVLEGIAWVAQRGYCEWTLETVLKKWPEFISSKKGIRPKLSKAEQKPNFACEACKGIGKLPDGKKCWCW